MRRLRWAFAFGRAAWMTLIGTPYLIVTGLPAGGGPRLGLSARAKKKQRQRERKRQRAMHAAPVQAKHGASS